MTAMISFPFRVLFTGQIATSDEGSSQIYAEQLTQLALTRPKERLGAPEFGISDIVGDTLDRAELISKLLIFGPPVTVINISEEQLGDNSLAFDITFEPSDYEVFGRE